VSHESLPIYELDEEIVAALREVGFTYATLDLTGAGLTTALGTDESITSVLEKVAKELTAKY
jgi:hypothetical protein